MVVEGKSSDVFRLADGRRMKGRELLRREEWTWHDSAQFPGIRYIWVTVCRPTSAPVTLVIVKPPGRDRYDPVLAPRLVPVELD